MFDIAYCTYFDSNYFSRGLALYHSLTKHCKPFELYVMALDDLAYKWLQILDLPNVVVFPVDDILDPELEKARDSRDRVEFIWTCTPAFIWHCWKQYDARRIFYLDADTYFFSDPLPLFRELRRVRIGITPHRFPPQLAWRVLKNGTYNLGSAFFDQPNESYRVLWSWRKQCIEWCGKEYQDDGHKCGDQGYLDDWADEYGAYEIQHPGVNLGPWNQMQYTYVHDKDNGILYIYHEYKLKPVILYHFHAWRPIQDSGYPLNPFVKQVLYAEYAQVFAEKEKVIKELRAASQA